MQDAERGAVQLLQGRTAPDDVVAAAEAIQSRLGEQTNASRRGPGTLSFRPGKKLLVAGKADSGDMVMTGLGHGLAEPGRKSRV